MNRQLVIKQHMVSIVFLWLIALTIICSRWTQELIPYPLSFARFFTICIYLPFVLLIALKVIHDIKSKALFRGKTNLLYYSFIFYYAIVSVHRFFAHEEFQESAYYFVVFIGAVGFLLMLINNSFIIEQQVLAGSIFVCSLSLIIYRVVFLFIGFKHYTHPPININILVAVELLLVISYLFFLYKGDIRNKKECSGILILSSITILIAGSRAGFCLFVLVVGVVLLVCFRNNKDAFKQIVLVLLASVVFTSALFVFDVEYVRNSVLREMWGMNHLIASYDNDGETEAIVQSQNEQIDRSDGGRVELIQMGIGEIKENPLFGTGDVLYEQRVGDITVNQSSHCFIIEFLVSYGLIGTLLGFCLLGRIAYVLFKRIPKRLVAFALLTGGTYFSFATVQPLFFNPLVISVFVIAMSCYYVGNISPSNSYSQS